MTTLHDDREHHREHVHDVVGIGFGPSNLALAIAIQERTATTPGLSGPEGFRAAFLERQPHFGWHRGMLIDDATMQVSFLKDLVTLRNPTSDFSFLAYLHDQGRLVDFLNQKTLYPLRIEFHDYLEWAAERLGHLVEYSADVVSVRPVAHEGEVRWFDVLSRDPASPGHRTVRRTRAIVVATGLEPRLPSGTALSERVWHNSELLPRVGDLLRSGTPVRRVVVLGAGQSAAEAVDFLHRSFPGAEICSVFAKYGYTPADDSPFANKIFDPEAVDVYFGAPPDVKRSLFDYHRGTNYSVVDMDLIQSLSRTMYREKVRGRQRLRMMNVSRIREVDIHAAGVRVAVEFLPTGEREVLAADLLVHATGYQPRGLGDDLGEVGKLCLRDEEDLIEVGRDHRVATVPNVTAGIYLQGGTEHTHGLTSTLLSTTAVRAGEICSSLVTQACARPSL
ncbi:SidA/IucD/PvdA family monooxygenase [Streptomyces sp. SCSIO 30461]|uniref:lysine N(6)-hydroxylase/L-ornithine N(5)-oxygenase family protein n=1 Tax=Streptomyces sp. SCSIO 30461 TaxID=3118085 RepID=UPI0030CD9B90